MPFSEYDGKEETKQWISEIAPSTILDIGPGAGTYKDLLTDIKAYWRAIEVYEPYVQEYKLNDKYDEVIISDIRYIADKWLVSDLIIAGDVIEHLKYKDAVEVLERLQESCKHLLISLPIVDYPQGAWGGNHFETHLYNWKFDEMKAYFGDSVVQEFKGNTLGVFLIKGHKSVDK